MEASAPKRRKTSPTSSVPVNESDGAASSDSITRRSSRLKRPSFASPTKASLARSNPGILQRRSSAKDDSQNEPPTALAASEPGSPTSAHDSEQDLVSAQLEHDSETGRQRDARSNETDNAPANRRTSPVRRAGGSLSMRPKKSPNKPSPRPLPPPSAEEEELIDPFKGRRLRRSPPPGVLPHVEPKEPELPPTPTQKGLSDPSAVASSPTGIHNTPSKRPRRSRIVAERMVSSPLKQPPLRPADIDAETGVEALGSSRPTRDALRSEPRRKRKRRKSHPARQIEEEPDPLADKKALRDALLSEVARLEEDLRIASRENERIYGLRESQSRRHTIAATTTATDLPDAKEQDRLIDILTRHALPPKKEAPPDAMQDWLEAAMNPIAFLPFGQAHAAALPSFIMPGIQGEKAETDAPLPPPTSHHPIPMTAAEELAYLQVFTPLTFTSTITTLRPQSEINTEEEAEDKAAPLVQRHAISATSSPPGLFAATIDMTVDTKTLAVTELSVPRLDPAAIGELGPFLETLLGSSGGKNKGDKKNNSALTRNVSVVTWAMGEWVRAATRRARFWHAAKHELGSKEGVVRCAEAMRRRQGGKAGLKKKGRGAKGRGKGKGRGKERDGDEDEDEGESGEAGREGNEKHEKSMSPKMADVVALMSRTSFDLDLSSAAIAGHEDGDGDGGESVTARIQWRIEFDWTGEARNKIGLLLGVPAKWHARDDKGSLAGLPGVFDKLLQERKDPLEALKIVVALIVGDGVV